MQRNLQGEFDVAADLGLEFAPGKMIVSPCAGSDCDADASLFQARGFPINRSQNIEVVKVPIGSRAFTEECVEARLSKTESLVQELCDLPDVHAALCILRSSS